jgi:hypothetical protein
MSPDPKIVREIAREALKMAARHRGRDYRPAAIVKSGILGDRPMGAPGDASLAWANAYSNLSQAVGAEMRIAIVTVTVSWPDEQQPADVVTAEQQQDGAAEDVAAFLDIWEAEHGSGSIRGGNADVPYLFSSDLRAVLAERTALAARVVELESERDTCTCGEPRKVCELRTELDRAHTQLAAETAPVEQQPEEDDRG